LRLAREAAERDAAEERQAAQQTEQAAHLAREQAAKECGELVKQRAEEQELSKRLKAEKKEERRMRASGLWDG
jgi:hypothetical protein